MKSETETKGNEVDAGAPDSVTAGLESQSDAEPPEQEPGSAEQELASGVDATESDPAQPAVAAASGTPGRVPNWVWAVLGILGVALVAVTLALFVEARDTSENAKAGAESAAQLLDDLVADVQTTNEELKEFNDQFASASASAQAKAAEAQQKQSQRSDEDGR